MGYVSIDIKWCNLSILEFRSVEILGLANFSHDNLFQLDRAYIHRKGTQEDLNEVLVIKEQDEM